MKCCVVIPMFGKYELTKRCVELTKQNAGVDVDILVVDDGSPEPFVDDSINVLRIEHNSGFTNAVNQGIIWCSDIYEYILLLNNDTEPLPDFVGYLIQAVDKDKSIGVACSVRTHKDENSVTYYANHGVDLIRGYQNVSAKPLTDLVVFSDWVPFCSVLLRFEMIREIGLLDKSMRTHNSDTDYCLRATMNDWKVGLITQSRVYHHLSQTVIENKVDPSKDQRRFIEKLAGYDYAKIMDRVPLDSEQHTYGQISFSVDQR